MQLLVSSAFFEQLSAGVLVLDEDGEVQSASSAARQVLAVPDDQPVRLRHLCTTDTFMGSVREAVRRAARSQVAVQPLLLTHEDRELEVRFARALEDGVRRVVVTLHRRERPRAAAHLERFEIKTTAKDFGRVIWHQPRSGHESSTMAAGSFCFKQRFPRCPEVCTHCPARSLRAGDHVQRLVATDGCCAVLDVSARDRGTAEVQVHYLSEPVLEGLPRARVLARINGSGLTARERLVLDELLKGSSRPEIALRLGIAVRTVKFHERNLRAKLGADSRLDLFRVLI